MQMQYAIVGLIPQYAIVEHRINADYKVIFYGHFMHLLGMPSLAWNPWNAIVQIAMPYSRAVLELSHLDQHPPLWLAFSVPSRSCKVLILFLQSFSFFSLFPQMNGSYGSTAGGYMFAYRGQCSIFKSSRTKVIKSSWLPRSADHLHSFAH